MSHEIQNRGPQWFKKLHKQEKEELLFHFQVTDEALFDDAFMSCGDKYIRREAVTMIKDQDRLRDYALHDPDAGVRAAAAVRLTDNDLLLAVVQNDEDLQVRIDAAGSITDREMLYELASAHPDYWIRKAAVLTITDAPDLMMIVFSENEENELRLLAAQRITDEECLKYITGSAEKLSKMDHHNALRNSHDVRRAAVLKIKDHEMLRALAADYDEITLVRIAAVSRLGENDQDLLAKIAEKPYDPDPRRDPDLYYDPELKAAAVSRFTDRDLLRNYLDDRDWETRAEACIALGDEELLQEMVTNLYCPIEVRDRALRKIKDQDFLFEFAMHHTGDSKEIKLAAAAAKKIEDPSRLADIAMGAEEYNVSEAATKCLRDDAQLLRIITEIENHPEKWASSVDEEVQYVWEQEIKIAAAGNLEDRTPLGRLTLEDPGDHYGINNFKEYGIGLLCNDPELMLSYITEETDEWAITLAANFSVDENVLQAIADKGLKDTYASYKLKNLRRIGEVGLGRKTPGMPN